jgi:hypothetical protein
MKHIYRQLQPDNVSSDQATVSRLLINYAATNEPVDVSAQCNLIIVDEQSIC